MPWPRGKVRDDVPAVWVESDEDRPCDDRACSDNFPKRRRLLSAGSVACERSHATLDGSRQRPGQLRDHVARDEPGLVRRDGGGEPMCVAAAAAAVTGSSPLARNAATIPVSTSPVPAVASEGGPVSQRQPLR